VGGRPERLAAHSLAIVGSGAATQGGCETSQAFSRALAEAGLTIVSGLAEGIDAAAHRGALDTPAGTVAVFGTGLDRVYPARHAGLARAILERGGAVVSEFPPGTGPRRASFPRRNRLIAGLSLGVLVVEAAQRSGSLITARQAGEFGREVFAIPGSIHAPLARGCHQLIRQGAKLVETANDVLEELVPLGFGPADRASRPGGRDAAGAGGSAGTPDSGRAPDAPGAATSADSALLAAVGWDPVGIDTLADRLQRGGEPADPGALVAELLALELARRVERLADGRYRRTRDR
jgi:DNA processing protein